MKGGLTLKHGILPLAKHFDGLAIAGVAVLIHGSFLEVRRPESLYPYSFNEDGKGGTEGPISLFVEGLRKWGMANGWIRE
jgi:hypothetical protein